MPTLLRSVLLLCEIVAMSRVPITPQVAAGLYFLSVVVGPRLSCGSTTSS